MQLLIACCSLNPDSRSAVLAAQLRGYAEAHGASVDWLDLRNLDLPVCDGSSSYARDDVRELGSRIQTADAVILAVPIYNYSVNSAAKNLLELTGSAWSNKVVAFACSAGGRSSYMAVMSLANNLMLDYRCHIVPRFVYADTSDFAADGIAEAIEQRLDTLALQTILLAKAVKDIPTLS